MTRCSSAHSNPHIDVQVKHGSHVRKMLRSNATLRPQLQQISRQNYPHSEWIKRPKCYETSKKKKNLLLGKMSCVMTCLSCGLFLCAFACELVFMLLGTSECLMRTVRPNPPEARNVTILNLHHAVCRNIEFSYTTAYIIEDMRTI